MRARDYTQVSARELWRQQRKETLWNPAITPVVHGAFEDSFTLVCTAPASGSQLFPNSCSVPLFFTTLQLSFSSSEFVLLWFFSHSSAPPCCSSAVLQQFFFTLSVVSLFSSCSLTKVFVVQKLIVLSFWPKFLLFHPVLQLFFRPSSPDFQLFLHLFHGSPALLRSEEPAEPCVSSGFIKAAVVFKTKKKISKNWVKTWSGRRRGRGVGGWGCQWCLTSVTPLSLGCSASVITMVTATYHHHHHCCCYNRKQS